MRVRGMGVLLAAALAAGAPPAAADPLPAGARFSEAMIPSAGAELHADVLLPAAHREGDRRPVALVAGPYFGTSVPGGTAETGALVPDLLREGPRIPPYYADLVAGALARGYAVVQVSLRGFGESTGCNDFGGPGERADARTAVAWAAAQPWSDGRVGMWGTSYDGWATLMAAAGRPPGLRAIVPMAAPVSAYRTMHLDGVRYFPFALELPFAMEELAYLPPSLLDDAGAWRAWLGDLPRRPGCSAAKLAQLTDNPYAPYWTARDLAPALQGSEVPVLFGQGTRDENVRADHLLPALTAFRGPRRLWFGQFAHHPLGAPDRGGAAFTGRGGFTEEALDFLDAHVREDPAAQVRLAARPSATVQEGDGRWRGEASWPPADATPFRTSVLGGAYLDLPGNTEERRPLCLVVRDRCFPSLLTGVGLWTLTPRLPHEAHLAGEGIVRAFVRPLLGTPAVIALLYDVAPDGQATFVARGAVRVARAGQVTARLGPQDWRFRAGHRIGLLLTSSDDAVLQPGTTALPVAVSGGTLELPLLRCRRTTFLEGGPAAAMAERGPFPVPATVLATRTVPGLPPAPQAC